MLRALVEIGALHRHLNLRIQVVLTWLVTALELKRWHGKAVDLACGHLAPLTHPFLHALIAYFQLGQGQDRISFVNRASVAVRRPILGAKHLVPILPIWHLELEILVEFPNSCTVLILIHFAFASMGYLVVSNRVIRVLIKC